MLKRLLIELALMSLRHLVKRADNKLDQTSVDDVAEKLGKKK